MKNIFFFFLPIILIAQNNGDVAQAFGNGTSGGFNNSVHAVKINQDNSIYVGGDFTQFKGENTESKLIKLTPFGNIDYSFNANSYNRRALVIKTLANGKILVGSAASSISLGGLDMFNPDGTIDEEFNIGSGFNNDVNDFVIQGDGKIVVVGEFYQFNNSPVNKVIRLNSDGSLDTTFNFSNSLTVPWDVPRIECVKIDNYGRILIGGYFDGSIFRLNNNGSIQAQFKPNNEFGLSIRQIINGTEYLLPGTIEDILVTENDEIIGVGYFESYGNESIEVNNIVRFSESASIDLNFLVNSGADLAIAQIEKADNNNYILMGSFNYFQDFPVSNLCMIDLSGNINTSFNAGNSYDSVIRSMSINNNIYAVGGEFEYYNGGYAGRIISSSTTGINQFSQEGFDYDVQGLFNNNNNALYVFGEFNQFNDQQVNGLVKLNEEGFSDESFNIGLGFNGLIKDLVVLPNEDIIAVGEFTSFNNISTNRIVKLHPDGSIDTSFQSVQGFDQAPYDIELVDSENAVLISGSFNTYNNTQRKSIIKLNLDGSIATGFNPNSVIIGDVVVRKMVNFNSNFLIAYQSLSGNYSSGVKLMNSSGQSDTNFQSINLLNVTDIKINSNNKILVSTSAAPYLQKYNSNGTNDTSFLFSTESNYPIGHTNTFWAPSIQSISIDENNNIYAGGFFNYFRDRNTGELLDQNNFIVLNENGLKLDNFDLEDGFNSRVNSTVMFNNKLYIGGNFTQYRSTLSSYLISIFYNNQTLSINESFQKDKILIYPNPVSNQLNIATDENLINRPYIIYDMLGKAVKFGSLSSYINVDELEKGMYFLNIANIRSIKFIKN